MDSRIKTFFDQNRIVKATLSYSVRPSEDEMEALNQVLKDQYDATEIIFEEIEDPELIAGYVLRVGDLVFDSSAKGSFEVLEQKMKQDKSSAQSRFRVGSAETGEVISILQEDICNFEPDVLVQEVGTVIWVGDGIARIEGIYHVTYGEIIVFENGTRGLVQNIDREILCIILGDGDSIREGDRVVRTGKRAGVPVGDEMAGRVVNPLGAPIDGKGEIRADSYNMLEREAPGVVKRQSVSVPLQTGILAVDSMFPIGRGQRELIIGDRQTGKTSIAVDTIINQKGQDVICVYVAIAQKASTIAQVAANLEKHGALEYTIIVASTASDNASLQYIAPYAGTAMAEYFMDQGKDVLIVYDDLSKHAVAYRALSLLLERSPGREAYPGDVFYLHSRLLERSCRLNQEHGGGSITALPIVETQAGDVSAYIPTNVISITDGQIFLESDLFFAGNRPAVNVGLSVSRVGGAAQTKAMKKAAGCLRIDLAQYKEMESFSQFGSDLDEETRNQLLYGKGLMELLKQPLYQPKPVTEQVIILYLATHRCLVSVGPEVVREFAAEFVTWLSGKYFTVVDEIKTSQVISDENGEKLLQAAEEFKKVKQYGRE